MSNEGIHGYPLAFRDDLNASLDSLDEALTHLQDARSYAYHALRKNSNDPDLRRYLDTLKECFGELISAFQLGEDL